MKPVLPVRIIFMVLMLDERGVKSGVCKWTGMFLSSCDRDARAGQMYVLRISFNKKKRKPNRATE